MVDRTLSVSLGRVLLALVFLGTSASVTVADPPKTKPAPEKKKPVPKGDKKAPPAPAAAKPGPPPAKPVTSPPPDPAKIKAEQERQRKAKLREEAGKYYVEGLQLYKKELYNAAIKVFRKSYKIFPMPITVYNIAKSYERLGVAESCILWFEKYVKLFQKQNKKDPNDILDIKNAISKCRLGLRLEITFESEPKGASVYIGGTDKLRGQTPMRTKLKPGTHKITLKMAGFVIVKRKIVVRKGESRKLFFKLEKLTKAGRVKIKCNIRGASIFLDGRNVGRTPFVQALVLNEGSHQITVEKDDYESVNKTIDVRADQTYEVDASLWLKTAPQTWKKPVGWVSISFGLLLITGGFAAGYYVDNYGIFQGTDDFKLYTSLQKVGYIGGGILTGLGLTLLIWEAVGRGRSVKKRDKLTLDETPRRPIVTPLVSIRDGGGFVGAHLRF